MGGYLVAVPIIGVDHGAFWSQMNVNVDFRFDVVNGVIKSVVFGVACTIIALYEGYDAPPTAEGVSRATTRTVVTSSLTVLGLDFILNLKPVTYNYNFKAIDPKSQNNNIRYSGFIAQEVEQTAKKVNYNFSGVDVPKNQNDFYSLRYAEFVVPIVKSIQEQQKTIEALKLELELQKQKNETLEKRLKAIEEKLK